MTDHGNMNILRLGSWQGTHQNTMQGSINKDEKFRMFVRRCSGMEQWNSFEIFSARKRSRGARPV
jgi:hypothetical protein